MNHESRTRQGTGFTTGEETEMHLESKGSSLTFQLYDAHGISIVGLAKYADNEDNRLFVPDEKPGFVDNAEISEDGMAVFTTLGAIVPFDIERIDDEGKVVAETFFRVDKCGILAFEDAILMTGRPGARKQAVEILSAYLMQEITPVKFDQGIMRRFEGDFIMVKSVQLDEVPHAEIKKIRLFGRIEDIYAFSGLDVSHSKISSISGTFKLGEREYATIKVVESGRISICGKKGTGIKLKVIEFFKNFIRNTPREMPL